MRDIFYIPYINAKPNIGQALGCGGAMGANVYRSSLEREDCEVVAGIDPRLSAEGDYPVFASFDECNVEVDVIVDFSSAAVTDAMLTYALAKKLPVIVCSTGHDEAQLEAIKAASEHIAVFRSGNMSLGINLLISLQRRPLRFWAQALISRSLSSITTARWMPPAERL